MFKRVLIALAFSAPSVMAQTSPHIERFTPQGVTALVESVQVRFNQPVSDFGDGQAQAPMQIHCDDDSVVGDGAWADTRNWSFVFRTPPGPGVSCTAQLAPDFRTPDGQAITGRTSFSFATGGPHVVSRRPYGNRINEDQIFVLRFNGAVDPASLQQHTYCAVQGLGEAVPVRLIAETDQRAAVLDALYMSQYNDDPAVQLVQCKRRLPPDARVELVLNEGVSSASGVASVQGQSFQFEVRPPFKASVGCQRENARAPCTPVLPITLTFNAPVPLDMARQIRLQSDESVFEPAKLDDLGDSPVQRVEFRGSFQPESELSLTLPEGLQDDAGRSLSNAGQFPLKLHTADYPPLVKFSSATFGAVERFANLPPGAKESDHPATVPLTVRHVEHELLTRDLSQPLGSVRDYRPEDDVEVLRWYSALNRLQAGRWTQGQIQRILDGRQPGKADGPSIDVRGYSVLGEREDVRRLVLPAPDQNNGRPLEVIGVPVAEPGFHVLEVESPKLGQALLGADQPMYVRSGVLVTNLAVHLKQGRDDVLVWLTTLDEGQVVNDADIRVLDCRGAILAEGRTNENGIWHHLGSLDAPDWCNDTGLSGLFVSARIGEQHPLSRGKADYSFVLSDWNGGFEPWRFNVPTDRQAQPTVLTHTVFDRSLLRAGETVFMKHFARVQTRDGLALPAADQLPDKLQVTHVGSGQRHEQELHWASTPSGGLSAQSEFVLPRSARLGEYSVTLQTAQGYTPADGSFRVEEFKLPVLEGSLIIRQQQAQHLQLIAPEALTADIQLSYLSGGPAAELPVTLSAVVRDKTVRFSDYDDYSFDPPADKERDPAEWQPVAAQKLVLDKMKLTLDKQGVVRAQINQLPAVSRAGEYLFEAAFSDPNGQIQTLTQAVQVWPSAAVAGIRTGSWAQQGRPIQVDALALSTNGTPLADVPMQIRAVARQTYSTRQRMVGGFYSYEHHTQLDDLGPICEGRSDAQGMLRCEAGFDRSGAIELIATATDEQGRVSSAASTVWLMGGGDLWFEADNDDRIDIIPEKKVYEPGETAEFQVRMPFRQAVALVTIEREGVLASRVVSLNGDDPRIQIPIGAEWGPNVYVSVLVLRGRLREVPWYSLLTWGWKQPTAWLDAYRNSAFYQPPSALIDLAKPAFRFGLTEIRVQDQTDRLQVRVTPEHTRYQIRETVAVDVQVLRADGSAAANGQVAFVAVDEALLELDPNASWNLLEAMRQRRSYGVQTATGQSQVVGRRHYGRKALPAGGGGGTSPTRELLDTLLLWKPAVQLDGEGRARIEVPLNDSITSFKLMAIADYGVDQFGEGNASVVATQDVQVISGLPALVREADQYQASVTVRNTTEHAMPLRVSATFDGQGFTSTSLPSQHVELDAGQARTVSWDVRVPQIQQLDTGKEANLQWTLQAQEEGGEAADSLLVEQQVQPSVPIAVHQAALHAVDESTPLGLSFSVPQGALTNADGLARGGLEVYLQSSLGGDLPGVYQWFAQYPYTCLEQLWSRAIGMGSLEQWQTLTQRLPEHLDQDGLAAYFPGSRRGSEVLTAYLLAASHEARSLGATFTIPNELRQSMLDGLVRFAEGRITRSRWAPMNDLHLRKLLVLEALAREGMMRPSMLDSIQIAPDRWPTAAVIDWYSILKRVPPIANRDAHLEKAEQVLAARTLNRGTEMVFVRAEQNDLWWLMRSPQVDAARFLALVVDEPKWQDAVPRLAQGLIAAQRDGAWRTTTENLWASLAMQKFAQVHEQVPVAGTSRVGLAGSSTQSFEWSTEPPAASSALSHEPTGYQTPKGAQAFRMLEPWPRMGAGHLEVTHEGYGTVWAWTRSLAAVPVTKAVVSGFEITRHITPVTKAHSSHWSRGDIYRVRLEITARTDTVWAVVSDAIPAGATILGSGLGRDSAISTHDEQRPVGRAPSFVERTFGGWRAYFEYLPKGVTEVEYTVRLNTVGRFNLPPTRAEALYQPDVFGVLPPSAAFEIQVE